MHCWGELKSIRAQSIDEVSASCVQFSGYVENESQPGLQIAV